MVNMQDALISSLPADDICSIVQFLISKKRFITILGTEDLSFQGSQLFLQT